jgi:hypothetical protein
MNSFDLASQQRVIALFDGENLCIDAYLITKI